MFRRAVASSSAPVAVTADAFFVGIWTFRVGCGGFSLVSIGCVTYFSVDLFLARRHCGPATFQKRNTPVGLTFVLSPKRTGPHREMYPLPHFPSVYDFTKTDHRVCGER